MQVTQIQKHSNIVAFIYFKVVIKNHKTVKSDFNLTENSKRYWAMMQ